MVKVIFKWAMHGISWGCAVALFQLVRMDLTNPEQFQVIAENFTANTIPWVITMFGFFIGAFIYEFERLAALFQIAIHFFIGLAIFLTTGFVIGWFSLQNPINILVNIGISIISFFVVWFIYSYIEARQIKQINKALEENAQKRPYDTE